MKFLASIILLLTSVIAFSQEADRNFRIGLRAQPNLSWLTEDRIETEKGNMSLGFNYGLVTDFHLSNNLWFATGLNVNSFGGSINANQADSSMTLHLMTATDTLQFTSRKYTFSTVSIPLTIKMKTKEIGYLTYWGQFGLNASYTYKARATKNNVIISGTETELSGANEEMDIISDSNPIRVDLNIGLGAEYSLAGSTSLLMGLNWENGILRSLQKESELLLLENNGVFSPLTQQIKTNSVVLTIGILF